MKVSQWSVSKLGSTYRTMSPVPRELSPIIPHTETSAGIDRRYAASFLEMQQVILSDALKSWPMRHHTVWIAVKTNLVSLCCSTSYDGKVINSANGMNEMGFDRFLCLTEFHIWITPPINSPSQSHYIESRGREPQTRFTALVD